MYAPITSQLTERQVILLKYALDVHGTYCGYAHLMNDFPNIKVLLEIAYSYWNIYDRMKAEEI